VVPVGPSVAAAGASNREEGRARGRPRPGTLAACRSLWRTCPILLRAQTYRQDVSAPSIPFRRVGRRRLIEFGVRGIAGALTEIHSFTFFSQIPLLSGAWPTPGAFPGPMHQEARSHGDGAFCREHVGVIEAVSPSCSTGRTSGQRRQRRQRGSGGRVSSGISSRRPQRRQPPSSPRA